MLLRFGVVAICFSAVSLSVIGQTPWDTGSKEIERKSKLSNSGDFSFPKDRSASSAVEGSGAGGTGTNSNSLSAWPGINDDEDDPRGQPEAAAVDGSGAGAVPRRGSIGFDDEEDGDEKSGLISGNVEGSGEGPPAKVYPKVNKNDDADWQTPWEPATHDPSTASHPDQKSKSGVASNDVKPKLDKDDDFVLRGGEKKKEEEEKEKGSSGAAAGGEGRKATVGEDVHVVGHGSVNDRPASFFAQPGILAAVIGGVVVGLLCTVLLLMYIVYRMRKMDEGSYPLEEPRKTPSNKQSQEFFA